MNVIFLCQHLTLSSSFFLSLKCGALPWHCAQSKTQLNLPEELPLQIASQYYSAGGLMRWHGLVQFPIWCRKMKRDPHRWRWIFPKWNQGSHCWVLLHHTCDPSCLFSRHLGANVCLTTCASYASCLHFLAREAQRRVDFSLDIKSSHHLPLLSCS